MKQPKSLSSVREMRTFSSGALLDHVGPHVDGAYRQGHVCVNQGGSARDRLLRAGIVYKRLAPVRFLTQALRTLNLHRVSHILRRCPNYRLCTMQFGKILMSVN